MSEEPKRYYYSQADCLAPWERKSKKQYVPAAPLDYLAVSLLRKVVETAPLLEERLFEVVQAEDRRSSLADGELRKLTDERDKLNSDIKFIMQNYASIGDEIASNRLAQVRKRLDGIDRRISQATEPAVPSEARREQIRQVLDGLKTSPEWTKQAPDGALRRLLLLLVKTAVVDIDSRHVEFEFGVPKWLLDGPEGLSPDGLLACKATVKASDTEWLPLMRYRVWRLDGNEPVWVGIGMPGAYR